MKIRVGMGFDVHQLEEGRDFWLGGIKLPAEKGAVGHSDADVLVHAICDALLGAANLGDIGHHFPNTDPKWKGMKSTFFLQEVVRMITEKGWQVENLDCSLCLEKPKINPHIPAMKQVLAPLMGISDDVISIKATTNERMGYVGRGEGVNAYAVALISKA
ncbi:MAG TPA: 2-C-methyl-D-erythritol 2,4-cyclodiphosphate synthase [Cyclobacteriaceae bacterium]|nr:2-C-methyl-D-erythritol 2,4-cyclodiphosphate synthase [Cyclobacteriaceae bacterium]MCB9237506.1 2-C-methyl-D-erythritol 2,4-cyclodiphosphate synthase [Flammeovirgaceae bacterium]MCB0500323.1 2-C-methyl-D-erythritol 2,4-cyclodiphosphate synthase [Cyclobacteriaceae bacterium]MCO5270391.1 2-C-methyl-D-erythritol 2,4-cyclodiphosphate synthase [Cyclobacteriaceae bacterium]MCW5903562.1 2-C-methyl-D-erythritol 2,4-cyclodiphosphate synthase [Cyclobacteriaceae bacterium]